MSHAVTIAPSVHPCILHKHHSPQPWTTELHHVILESWTDKLGLPQARLVALCPVGHDAIHVAIRLTIQERPLPYKMSPGMAELVREAVVFYHEHQLTTADLL